MEEDKNQKFEEVTNYNYTDAQLKLIEKFTDTITTKITTLVPGISTELQDLYASVDVAVRFLNAREFNEAKSLEMWQNWVKWHQSYRPDLISDTEETIQKQLATGKLFWHKFDNERRPCLYYRMRFHVPHLATADESVRFFLFMLEKGIKEGNRLGSEGRICVIYDRRGYTKTKYDDNAMKTMKLLMPILQDCYPERLSRFYVLGANWFYRAAYKVVSTFMSKKTSDKVRVLGDDSELLQYVTKDNLIKEYGGDSDPLQNTGANLKITTGDQCSAVTGDSKIEAEDDVEDEEALKEMQKKMFQDAGVKLN